jgi:hypothetical protein
MYATVLPGIGSLPQLSVCPDDREIRRLRNRSIDCQEAGNLIGEIILIGEPRPGGSLYENARMALPVAANIEVVPGVFNRHMAPTDFRQWLNAFELIKGRRAGVKINRGVDSRHDGWAGTAGYRPT